MTYALDKETVDRIAAMPVVIEAAKAADELTALWPLDGALRMDNDAKYTEDLQVRTTLAFARVLTGLDVTMADAEFVYEGADSIPGRPQEVVDALLALSHTRHEDISFGQVTMTDLSEDFLDGLFLQTIQFEINTKEILP